jgi:hypothetical protein
LRLSAAASGCFHIRARRHSRPGPQKHRQSQGLALFATKTDGTWESEYGSHGDQKTGATALAVYALLSAGDSHQDSRLIPAITYLKKTDTTGVYALGMRCQVWLALPPSNDVKAAMAKDARALVAGMKRTGEGKGFYDYNAGGKNYSHSRSQYAVLGLWAATQMGIEVPRDYWGVVEKSWIEHQDASGSWNYVFKNDRYPPTPGMTAVGVATLFITQDFLHAGEGFERHGRERAQPRDRARHEVAHRQLLQSRR